MVIVELASGKRIAQYKTLSDASAIAMSSGGKAVAVASMGPLGRRITLWDIVSGRRIVLDDEMTDWDVICLAFSPDDKILAAGGQGGVIKLWDISSLR